MANIDVNYKNKKRYKTAKYPIRQPRIIVWLIWILCKLCLLNKNYRVEKINMEWLKPPYMVLSNHMYFIDFKLAAMATFPHRVNNVVSIAVNAGTLTRTACSLHFRVKLSFPRA